MIAKSTRASTVPIQTARIPSIPDMAIPLRGSGNQYMTRLEGNWIPDDSGMTTPLEGNWIPDDSGMTTPRVVT
jgi:hypothetical protein